MLTADGAPASIDFDFENNRAYVLGAVGTPDSFLTCTRAAATAYYLNSSGNWTLAAINTIRYTYNAITLAAEGAYIEEARTNSIRNNSMAGVVAGSPGTAPTNWTLQADAVDTVSRTIVGSGTENGINYVDIRYFTAALTTGAKSGSPFVVPETNTQVAAVNAQNWATSYFVSLVGGSVANATFAIRLSERDGAGALLANTDTAIIPIAGNLRESRFTTIRTNNNAGTAFEGTALLITYALGVAIDFTLRIGWPQLELGASVTSPIVTTSAAVTRNGDNVRMTLPSALQSLVAYSLYNKAIPDNPVAYPSNTSPGSISDTTTNNRVQNRRGATNGFSAPDVISGGATQYSQNSTPTAWAQSTSGKTALAQAANNNRGAFNGTLMSSAQTAAIIPATITTIYIGANGAAATGLFGGKVARETLFNFRISNTALQTITT